MNHAVGAGLADEHFRKRTTIRGGLTIGGGYVKFPTMAAGKRRKIAGFSGKFDPLTNGHLDVIRRGSKLFDQLIVAVGVNPEKTELFSLDQRVAMLRKVLGDLGNTKVMKYTGLTVDFVKRVKADVLLRGIRDVSDLRFE